MHFSFFFKSHNIIPPSSSTFLSTPSSLPLSSLRPFVPPASSYLPLLHLSPSFTALSLPSSPLPLFRSILNAFQPLSLHPSVLCHHPLFFCPLIISRFLISPADSSSAGPFSHRLLIRRKQIRKATLYPANGVHAHTRAHTLTHLHLCSRTVW